MFRETVSGSGCPAVSGEIYPKKRWKVRNSSCCTVDFVVDYIIGVVESKGAQTKQPADKSALVFFILGDQSILTRKTDIIWTLSSSAKV